MRATYGFQATMTARPGKGDELSQILLTAVRDGGNPNCVLFVVGQGLENRDVVHVWEGWISKEAHAENFTTEKSKALIARLGPLLQGEAQYQDVVPVGGKVQN